jgi:hypothetical protein
VTLISPTNDQFATLVDDIRRRTQIRNPQGPPFPPEAMPDNLEFAGIRINHSEKAIAGLAIEWKFENMAGHPYSHRSTNPFGRSLLLPFGTRPEQLAIAGYWQTILPGSKRLLAGMKILGDNTDVRPPRDEEVWRGGGIGSGGGGSNSTDAYGLRSVVLVIDGVFFVDGEFIGPNQMHLWEDVYYEADVKLPASRIAAAGKARGLSTAEIMIDIDRYTGPLPDRGGLSPMASRESLDPEDFRRWHRGQLAKWFSHLRQQQQEDGVVKLLVSWLDAPPPKLRRS